MVFGVFIFSLRKNIGRVKDLFQIAREECIIIEVGLNICKKYNFFLINCGFDAQNIVFNSMLEISINLRSEFNYSGSK